MAVLPELREGDPLPSPESLRGKIVIKGKVVRDGEVRACFFFGAWIYLFSPSADCYYGVSTGVTAVIAG